MTYNYYQGVTKQAPNRISLAIIAFVSAVILSLGVFTSVFAYTFPSTNDTNRTNGFPHVNEVSNSGGEVTLEFVNDTNSLAFFEYRIDGEELTSGTAHPVVDGDFIYPGVSVESRGISDPVVVTETFTADETVEVRLALGGERDWDFDWTTFKVVKDVASNKDQCMNGGWEEFTAGYKNQGQCIASVVSNENSKHHRG